MTERGRWLNFAVNPLEGKRYHGAHYHRFVGKIYVQCIGAIFSAAIFWTCIEV